MVTWTNVWQSQELTKEMTSAGDQYTSLLIDFFYFSCRPYVTLDYFLKQIIYDFVVCTVSYILASLVLCLTLHVDVMYFLNSTFYN